MRTQREKRLEWFEVSSLASVAIDCYFERRWFNVALELFSLIWFATPLNRSRVWIDDCSHLDNADISKSTRFVLKYDAESEQEGAKACRLMQREALRLKSQGWLEIEHKTIGKSPTLLIRALKFIGEDSESPTQAPQQKHHTKKTKVTQTEKKQTAGAEVVRASQQKGERSLKELEASVATLKKQYLEAYQQLRDKVLNYLKSKAFDDELRKQIRGIREQEKQKLEAHGAKTEHVLRRVFVKRVARRAFVEDLLNAVKSIDHSKAQKQHEKDSHRQELMTEIAEGMFDLLRKEGKEAWDTQVSKMFEFTTHEKGTQQGAETATMDEVTRELTRLRSKLTSGKGDVKDVRALSKQYDLFLDILKRDILKKEKTSSSEAKSKWVGKDLETMIRQSSKISKGKQKQLIELARMMSSSHRKDLMELIEKTGV